MTRVLLTGVTGFIGRYVRDHLLAMGHEVLGLSTRASSIPGHFQCDITDARQVSSVMEEARPDCVLHSAALSSVTAGQALDYYRINVVGTENLLKTFVEHGSGRRFIFISTAGVYGNQQVEVLTEDLCPKPVHHYGMSKFAAEQIVKNHASRLDYTIVRPFNLIGVGQDEHFIVPKLTFAFQRGDRSVRLGNLDVYRDYLDVQGAAHILASLVDNERSFAQVMNLCTGQGVSLRELIAMLESIAGYQIDVVTAPEFVRDPEVWRLLGSAERLREIVPGLSYGRPLRTALLEVMGQLGA